MKPNPLRILVALFGIFLPLAVRADPAALRLDDAETEFGIVNTYDTKDGVQFNPGWALQVSYQLNSNEDMQPGSMLRFTVKQKGKVQGELACAVAPNGTKRSAHDTCYDSKQQLQLVGDVDVDAVYIDAASDTETTLRSFKLKVMTATQIRGNLVPAASQQYVSWQGRGLDNVLVQVAKWSSSTDALVLLYVRFAPAYETEIPSVKDTALFCSVDGKLLPTPERADVFQSLDSTTEQVVARTVQVGKASQNEYRKVSGVQLRLPMTFGAEADAAAGAGGKGAVAPPPSGLWVLEEHPGKWECKWKHLGKVLRIFRFAVADGKFVPHPEQLAGLNLRENEVLVETVIPADSLLDGVIAADEIKAGGFFGRPWATAEGKAMAAAVPAKGTPHYPQPKKLDFGQPVKKWEFAK